MTSFFRKIQKLHTPSCFIRRLTVKLALFPHPRWLLLFFYLCHAPINSDSKSTLEVELLKMRKGYKEKNIYEVT